MVFIDDHCRGEAWRFASAIERWLLAEAQLGPAAGRCAGAVVNYLEPDGGWNGAYPEICGYFLQFLAAAAPEGEAGPHREAARRVVLWLAAVGAGGAPLTLYHRRAETEAGDWRNHCLFAFDLAIVLRGLDAAAQRWPGLLPAGVMEPYAAALAGITAEGALASHVRRLGKPSVPVPVKWSTLPGLHHLKAAAALAGLGRPELAAIARATVAREARLLDRHGRERMRELHPFLYGIEGWLTLWGQGGAAQDLERARTGFAWAFGQLDLATGWMPPVVGAPPPAFRSDVLAQMLRAGLVLEAAGALPGEVAPAWPRGRAALAASLRAMVTPEGAVAFDATARHRNSWAGMFAWQAFRFLDAVQAGMPASRLAEGII
ncbi:hypothetical protein [Rhodovastum atsumiense]|uniref:Mannose-6-phosphate isomerase n=1 Tax=Rhodovastum atsumiense TaxID=504468 RepID=A0A5M6IY28_9PROT|nr:hypothetical protein [Rhodovastum atsumiense]KAA5612869.1 hypothetical protein F1189_07445 [Rhodovastum atsumiense]